MRSRGHGVHSPFAYRFIREVLCESCGYYAYASLKTRHERLLYRIGVFLQPTQIISLGGAEIPAPLKAMPKSAVAAPPRWACIDRVPMAVASSSATAAEISDALSRNALIVIFGQIPTHTRSLIDNLSIGSVFTNHKDITIIVPSTQIPQQTYTLKI